MTTQDGYLLKLFRITGKINETSTKSRPPILFQHGLLDSSDSWVLNHVAKSPVFVAASAGYDVWLGNLRGNRHSRKHISLDADKSPKEFFNFDLSHHSRFDLKAIISYVREQTKAEFARVAYVGHSMGTTIMFRLSAEDSDFVRENVSTIIAIGPVLVPFYTTSPIVRIAQMFNSGAYSLFSFLSAYEFLALNHFSTFLIKVVCSNAYWVCTGALRLLASDNSDLTAEDRLMMMLGHYPAGTSLHVLFHFL